MTDHEDTADSASDPDGADLDPLLRGLGVEVNDALADGAMRCGPYILIDELGEGGFGQVFVAVRDDAVSRRVAIKILKRGVDTGEVLRRFEMEQRALARIDHPCVAAILDSGTTDDGRPWFAMPLLDGDPVTVACDDAGSSLAERLRLMTMICEAVQAAHVQGILHRDLKPANVLAVRGPDGQAVPKVIDFGIAKAIDPDGASDSTRTAEGRRVGTPAYMAPEQLAAHDPGADVRSDVYALGVIMAELVAGVRPQGAGSAAAPSLPLRVSVLFRSSAASEPDAAGATAARRGCRSAPELVRQLQGDIDAIVAKATMPEPELRYRSAEAMAEDLRRMALSLPVVARGPSRSYQFRRFVQRHRRAVAIAAAVTAGLVIISSLAIANAVDARRSAALASQNALRAQQVTGLLSGVFERIDPDVAQGRDRTMLVELLRATLDGIDRHQPAIDPKAAAEVSRIVADALIRLEQTQLAIMAIDDAIATVTEALDVEMDAGRRRELRIERAALRVLRGTALFRASWADSGAVRSRLDDPVAEAEWRAALDELEDVEALDTAIALLARLRLWRIREVWPKGMPVDLFDETLYSDMERAAVDEKEYWAYRLRRVEIQSWIPVLRDCPRVLAECEAALGRSNPLVVRARTRYLGFCVMAGIDSRTESWGDSIRLWQKDEELAQHWRDTEALASRVVIETAERFGPNHPQSFTARMWQLAAGGYRDGAHAWSDRYRQLRTDAAQALGAESALVRQIETTWRGVTGGYREGRWW